MIISYIIVTASKLNIPTAWIFVFTSTMSFSPFWSAWWMVSNIVSDQNISDRLKQSIKILTVAENVLYSHA